MSQNNERQAGTPRTIWDKSNDWTDTFSGDQCGSYNRSAHVGEIEMWVSVPRFNSHDGLVFAKWKRHVIYGDSSRNLQQACKEAHRLRRILECAIRGAMK
jgi:hypothetical protein